MMKEFQGDDFDFINEVKVEIGSKKRWKWAGEISKRRGTGVNEAS